MAAPHNTSRNDRNSLPDAITCGCGQLLATGVGVWVGAAACLSGSATVERRRTS